MKMSFRGCMAYKQIAAGFLLITLLMITGCSEKKEPQVTKFLPLEKLDATQYPDFTDDAELSDLAQSIRQSLLYYNRVPDTRLYEFGRDRVDAVHMRKTLETFLGFVEKGFTREQLQKFVRDRFYVYRSTGNGKGAGEVLFTGYYEPSLDGSLVYDSEYRYPLFSMPDDMLTIDLGLFSEKYASEPRLTARVNEKKQVVPYFTREEINAQAGYEERAKPIAYVKNRIDRFFLEIQGSGRVILKQGGVLRVHYHGKNGHPYRSIGRYLIDAGEIPKSEMSMQAIRSWLEANSEKMDTVFHYNPSFVFFKIEEGGPYGNIGVAVTPMRSVASDPQYYPKGALAYIETSLPTPLVLEPTEAWHPSSRFVLNQDSGGAIKGPARIDLFCGNGRYAEFTAGHMNHPGRLFFLVLKP